jgi:hypothetical protein
VLLVAVLPVTKHDQQKSNMYYFGHVDQYDDFAEFTRAFRAAPGELERTLDQIYNVSKIVARKYRRVRLGLQLFTAALLCSGSAYMLNELV